MPGDSTKYLLPCPCSWIHDHFRSPNLHSWLMKDATQFWPCHPVPASPASYSCRPYCSWQLWTVPHLLATSPHHQDQSLTTHPYLPLLHFTHRYCRFLPHTFTIPLRDPPLTTQYPYLQVPFNLSLSDQCITNTKWQQPTLEWSKCLPLSGPITYPRLPKVLPWRITNTYPWVMGMGLGHQGIFTYPWVTYLPTLKYPTRCGVQGGFTCPKVPTHLPTQVPGAYPWEWKSYPKVSSAYP